MSDPIQDLLDEVTRLKQEHLNAWNTANDMAALCKTAERERDEAFGTVDAFEEKMKSLAPHGICGCSYDRPGDLCMHHSPRLVVAIRERDEAARDKEQVVFALTQAETERDEAVALADKRLIWLTGRDNFIVSVGLWNDFMSVLAKDPSDE